MEVFVLFTVSGDSKTQERVTIIYIWSLLTKLKSTTTQIDRKTKSTQTKSYTEESSDCTRVHFFNKRIWQIVNSHHPLPSQNTTLPTVSPTVPIRRHCSSSQPSLTFDKKVDIEMSTSLAWQTTLRRLFGKVSRVWRTEKSFTYIILSIRQRDHTSDVHRLESNIPTRETQYEVQYVRYLVYYKWFIIQSNL